MTCYVSSGTLSSTLTHSLTHSLGKHFMLLLFLLVIIFSATHKHRLYMAYNLGLEVSVSRHTLDHSSQSNSLSSSVSSSPLSLSITPTLFHSKLKRYLSLNPSCHRPHPFHRTAFTDTGLLNGFVFSFSIKPLVWFVQ